ncbi:MAG TPA: MFS transporter, partial [Planctomycetota bacterium]|nr:MFS transporter [Planctomycetota bacterium]
QLLFGVLADRAWGRALLIGGTFTGAVCLASAGAVAHHFANDYTLLALFLIAGGLGIAAFHPPSVVLAADLGGKNRSLAISLFLSTGIAGFGLGPLVYVAWSRELGLDSTIWLAIPGVLACGLLALCVPSGKESASRRVDIDAAKTERLLRDHGAVLLPLFVMAVIRSMVFITFVHFLPTLAKESGLSHAIGAVNTAFIIGSAAGALTFGWIAPYANRRWLQAISVLAGTPLSIAAVSASAAPIGVLYLLLGAAGFFVGSTTSLHVAMGQEVAKRQASTVASLLMGFGWGVGALGSIAVGWLATATTVTHALIAVSVVPIITLPLVPRLRPREIKVTEIELSGLESPMEVGAAGAVVVTEALEPAAQAQGSAALSTSPAEPERDPEPGPEPSSGSVVRAH